MPSKAIVIDGTTLEGGGQLLRIAVGLSALTGVPIEINSIRGKRRGPGGLKRQHLTSVEWLAQACGAETEGAEVKSKALQFSPGCRKALLTPFNRNYSIDIGSPGSVTLVFQALLPFLLFSRLSHSSATAEQDHDDVEPITIRILGGTNVTNSPSVDYVAQVLLPTLAALGFPSIVQKIHSRGWATGRTEMGSVSYTVTPFPAGTTLPAFQLIERGEIVHFQATIVAPRIMEQEFRLRIASAKAAVTFEHSELALSFEPSGHDGRVYLLLVATTSFGYKLGRDMLETRNVKNHNTVVSNLVKTVFADLSKELAHGGCVDEHLRDQLVVFQALAKGRSMVFGGSGEHAAMSLHAETAWWIVEEILCAKRDKAAQKDEVDGLGFLDDGMFDKKRRALRTNARDSLPEI